MKMKEAFAHITTFQDKNFPDATAEEALLKLDEEYLEFGAAVYDLQREMSTMFSSSADNRDMKTKRERRLMRARAVGMELMDMLYCMNNFANKMGIDLDEMATLVKAKNDAREWEKNDNGTYSHIKKT